MNRSEMPAAYASRLTAYLSGEPIGPLLALFAEQARVERYIWGEPPRTYNGIEQIEESFFRLPPVGGSFHIIKIHIEDDAVHARFYTRDFPYPLSGMYRFELDESGRIARLYIAARYSRAHTPDARASG